MANARSEAKSSTTKKAGRRTASSKSGKSSDSADKPSRKKSQALPIIPLKDMVVYPRMIMPLFVSRSASLSALDEAQNHDKQLALLAQVKSRHAYPEKGELPKIGIHAQILQTLKLPDGSTRIMVECRQRIRLTRWIQDEPCLKAYFKPLEDEPYESRSDQDIMVQVLTRQFEEFMQQASHGVPEIVEQLPSLDDPGALADVIAAFLTIPIAEKQSILEILHPLKRLEASGRLLSRAMELQAIENNIHSRLRESIDQHQKEFFLKEKIRTIREELGEESESEFERYRKGIEALPSEEARKQGFKELRRLEKMPNMSSESGIIRTYLDTLLALPWAEEPVEDISLEAALSELDGEHYGLEKVKDRILEYLAVQILTEKPPKTVLCMVGPPGVGKTSLARAIAKATGRKFERIALGGVGDDAEIRGHRRTYIGSMPGRLIQALQRLGSNQSLILLDELDKLTRRFSGDPASALLEVLDPEQNNAFRDHYLDVPFDLSKIMFVCAANVTHTIPRPLLDRLEMLRLSGYTEKEKIQIARQHLIRRQSEESGMKGAGVTLTKEGLIQMIRRYTRESGVRELERSIGKVYRYLARRRVENKDYPRRIQSLKQLSEILGPPRFSETLLATQATVGLVNGLAWTEQGGSVLPIEMALSPGKGKLHTTGNLGDVMKESMQMGLACVRQMAESLGIDPERFQDTDIHLHAPEGGIPKDGPSAGLAVATALVSGLTGRPVKHSHAMTGELTLLGRALPIGGVREKLLAAHREGLSTVLLPRRNSADLQDLPEDVAQALEIRLVDTLQDVLDEMLLESE